MTNDAVGHKTKQDVEIAREYTTFDTTIEAKRLYDEISRCENDLIFRIALTYHLGIVEGKRQERTRRKKYMA